jgi:hypothetical protein
MCSCALKKPDTKTLPVLHVTNDPPSSSCTGHSNLPGQLPYTPLQHRLEGNPTPDTYGLLHVTDLNFILLRWPQPPTGRLAYTHLQTPAGSGPACHPAPLPLALLGSEGPLGTPWAGQVQSSRRLPSGAPSFRVVPCPPRGKAVNSSIEVARGRGGLSGKKLPSVGGARGVWGVGLPLESE